MTKLSDVDVGTEFALDRKGILLSKDFSWPDGTPDDEVRWTGPSEGRKQDFMTLAGQKGAHGRGPCQYPTTRELHHSFLR
jgi:hypothetical protein